MKFRLVQLNPVIGDIRENTKNILRHYRNAVETGIDAVVFPELAVCGYPPMDLLERPAFQAAIFRAVSEIEAATSNTTIIFGAPTPNSGASGRRIFNSAIVARHGKRTGLVHKTLLPTYDVFDDFRYFEPNRTFELIDVQGIPCGISICEDFWNNENEIIYHRYDIDLAKMHRKMGAKLLINISASPFSKQKSEKRLAMLEGHVRDTGLPVLYCNQAGANTEVVFDGDCIALNGDGTLVARSPLFEETFVDVTWNGAAFSAETAPSETPPRTERLFRALVCGLRDYTRKSNMPGEVVLGLSGGIDSALVAVLAAEAFGAERVHAVMMPSAFSSDHSVSDSETLAKNVGIRLNKIPIEPAYNTFTAMLEPVFQNTTFGVAEENLQSRSRGVLLMALSNKFGWMLLNTGNKSEMATGYCTLYGDMAGGLSVIADLYKTEVYDLCRWLNEKHFRREIIPQNILTKPPSAELRPGQKDSDSLPDYAILDAILEAYIENQLPRHEIIRLGYDQATVDRVIRLVDRNEYKRRQAAPGLRMSKKAFGFGRRLPIVQGWTGHEEWNG